MKVKCFVSACKYNTAKTIVDCSVDQYCTKDEVVIDLNDKLTEFVCISYEEGGKPIRPYILDIDEFKEDE